MMPADRVLRELKSLGLDAIEVGSPGFFPDDVDEMRKMVDDAGVHLIAGFVPVVLHNRAMRDQTLREVEVMAERLALLGCDHFVSAVVVDADWSPRFKLNDDEWSCMFEMFADIDTIVAGHGLTQVLHPHVNTLVETADDVARVLSGSSVSWCLDTGHLLIGGFDPFDFARDYPDRIGLVHLKDVKLDVAQRLNDKELTLMEATFAGIFQSLGCGDVRLAEVIALLHDSGYDGWYVLEQDTAIVGEMPAEGTGPVEDIAVSLQFVREHLALIVEN
jgi:inosose dehydratase